jgi:hypothetical protein
MILIGLGMLGAFRAGKLWAEDKKVVAIAVFFASYALSAFGLFELCGRV